MTSLPLTQARIKWLQHLAKNGETSWARMPKRNDRRGTGRAISNPTWRPMIAAGLIEGRFAQRTPLEQKEWLFKITDAGREALATCGKGCPHKELA